MVRDPLNILLRIRETTVTEASRDLAAALAAAGAERFRLEAHQQHVRQEQANVAMEDIAFFAAWLPVARQLTNKILSDVRQKDGLVLQLQQVLVLCKTEAKAVANAVQRKKEGTDLAKARKEQAIMDEMGGRRKRA